MELEYLDIKAFGEFVRLTMAYLNIPYTEKVLVLKEDLPKWVNIKKKMYENEIDFPNLPNLKHNGNVITESTAIVKYLSLFTDNKDFFGKTDFEKVQVEQLVN